MFNFNTRNISRSINKVTYKLAFTLILGILSSTAFSQAPDIKYQTPQSYVINTPVTPLAPANTGGAVPATIYSQVSTFAGGRAPVTFDATGTGAGFNFPSGIFVGNSGNIYVSDFGSGAIRMITPATVVTTIYPYIGSPSGLVVDSHGNIFVTNFNSNQVFKIATNGVGSIFAGNGAQSSVDGIGTAASFASPGGIAIDAMDNLYVADQQSNEIRMVTPAGVVSTIAGNGSVGTVNSTTPTSASFNNPDGVAIDKAGNIYVADTKNNLIRKITPSGVVTTLAGSGTAGRTDGTGLNASFNYPTSITIDQSGNLYVTDFLSALIRKVTPAGVVTTIAGTGTGGTANGIGTSASFGGPLGSAMDASGNLYIADAAGYVVKKIVLTGYTIDKSLPPGLSFDPTTGIISGTPTAASLSTDYLITAYNSAGEQQHYSEYPDIIIYPGNPADHFPCYQPENHMQCRLFSRGNKLK